ncbi:MAG: GNAT family N-acetyltransferase [Candidatus Thiodiazotropha sp. (ex Monitilora ramsayi)]|nr:GNAT family N-acetyltransferase [Candidatus Thiodiazotropha sp. (ex Monitilora ramsayi)]
MDIIIEIDGQIEESEVVDLYEANGWSSPQKPDKLIPALLNSDTLVTARVDGKLVGIGNAISDGHLVVYYPHMLVHPSYQGKGIGRRMMELMLTLYENFHQQMITADVNAVGFYKKMGFERAGTTESMWIYSGKEH